jgi:hypothetical protein
VKNNLTSLSLLLPLTVCWVCPTPPAAAQQTGVTYHWPIHYNRPFDKTGAVSQSQAGRKDPLPKFHLTFHGGPVQTTTTSYAIYWKPSGSP